MRIRDPAEAVSAVHGSLRTIATLCGAYDGGDYDIAREIGAVIHRMIVDEITQTKLRGKIKFLSFCLKPNPKTLAMQYLSSVIDAHFYSDGGSPTITVTHRPLLDELAGAAGEPTVLSFKDWWNGPIWIAGAAPGMYIPAREAEQIPFEKRKVLSRLRLTENFRNKLGAHFSRQVDEAARTLEEREIEAFDLEINTPTKKFNFKETPEVFRFANTRAQAMIRQIAYEVTKSSTHWDFLSIFPGFGR